VDANVGYNINNMTKEQFLTKVQSKLGFHSIIQDELAPDNVAGDSIEKRFLYVNHNNADGTMGKTFVFYLYDTVSDIASFYNTETPALDNQELPENVKALKALETYLGAKYEAYFVIRYDIAQRIAEADVFTLTAGKLAQKKVLVFKKGASPVSDVDIV